MTSYLRLRQLCLVVRDLEAAVAEIGGVLGLSVCHRDRNVAKYGLINAVFPIGTSFLEVVAPIRDNTAAGRYLDRHGGAGGYMVIFDCNDVEERREHAEAIGIRIANLVRHGAYTGLQLHPRDTGGSMMEFNHTKGGERLDGPYHPAGPHWQSATSHSISTILAADLRSADPAMLAARWSAILKKPIIPGANGTPHIALDMGMLRFLPDHECRGEGLSGITLCTADPDRIVGNASKRRLPVAKSEVALCGIHFKLAQG